MSNIHVFSDVNKPVSSNPADGYTMPAKFYTDPAVYELQKTVIFSKTWHYIGHDSHVCNTGDYLTLDFASEQPNRVGYLAEREGFEPSIRY